jgi:hypothetical protein
MTLNLADYERQAREAVMAFWGNREKAKQKQIEAGRVDVGERAGVTAGNNMDGFIALMIDLVEGNGLGHAEVHRTRRALTLPGYFRPTKLWDLLVINEGRLVAALEFKSHVGPSYGNNANNRAEEAVGTAHDFWTAYREGAFGNQPAPFLGWAVLVEDAPAARTPIRDTSLHFPQFPEFQGASYMKRYEILCERLMKEKLYSATAAMASPRSAIETGEIADLSELSSLRTFVTTFAGFIAAEAARAR